MSHKSGNVIIDLVADLKGLEERLEHLSDEQREKVLEIVEKSRKDLAEI